VPSTYVSFHPEDGTRPSRGLTNENGEFTLKVTKSQTGALRGWNKVSLIYKPSGEEVDTEVKLEPIMIHAIQRCEDANSSGLRFEVTENGQFIEIEIP
jgi:hypothetical protein